jgi:positive regulator of sigma E activity
MEAAARVAWVRDGRAHLDCDSAPSCGACGSGAGCVLGRLARKGESGLEVPDRAEDRQPLRAGEPVVVVVADGDLLRAVALAYLPPLVGVLLAPLFAHGLTGTGEAGMLLAAIGGAATGGWLARAALLRRPPAVIVRRRCEADGGA